MSDSDYRRRDREVWNRIFAEMPDDWYDAPPSDAMRRCARFFAGAGCARLLDVGCGFGRWGEYLLREGAAERVVGIDNADRGVRAAAAWAARDRLAAGFCVASALDPPFRRSFDGLLVALLLDNLSRDDCRRAMRQLGEVMLDGAYGFFVFNPVHTGEQLASASEDNPTRGCMHVDYRDDELPGCLPGWSIERRDLSAEGFRLVEAVLVGGDRRPTPGGARNHMNRR